MNLLYNRKNFTLISKTLCISQVFLCLIVIFHKVLHLGDNICCRFNAVSINITYKTYKSTKSPIVLQNHLANVLKNQMSLSNGIMRLITHVSKFAFCLYSVKIVCIRSDSVLKSRLFFAKCFHFCRCNTWNKRPLFGICVVIAYFISFKPERKKILATYLGNEMSLFGYVMRSFSGRRSDVSFILQLIWGDAIFVKVVAVSFGLSFVARIVLTKLKATA